MVQSYEVIVMALEQKYLSDPQLYLLSHEDTLSGPELVTPPLLPDILHSLSQRSVNWDAVAERIRDNHVIRNGIIGTMDAKRAVGEVFEAILDTRLERFAARNDEAVYRPIRSFQETENFIFLPSERSNIRIQRKDVSWRMSGGQKKRHYELDGLILVNGIPVIIEAKTGKGTSGELERIMQPESIETVSEPIREYYKTERIGHAVVSATGIEPFNAIRDYEQRGGHFQRFALSYSEFAKKAQHAAQKISTRIHYR